MERCVKKSFDHTLSLVFFSSDIDLVILGKWEQTLPLHRLYEELVKSGIPKPNNLLVLDKAAVSTKWMVFGGLKA